MSVRDEFRGSNAGPFRSLQATFRGGAEQLGSTCRVRNCSESPSPREYQHTSYLESVCLPNPAFAALSLLLSAFIAAVVAVPAQAQAPRLAQLAGQASPARPAGPGQGQQTMQLAPPKAYKPIPVKAAQPNDDPSFDAFRKQLAEIARRRDRAALAMLTVSNFFWMGEQGDKANKKKSGIDNLAAAIELDDKGGSGWDDITAVADEPTLQTVSERDGIMCSPAIPTFDEAAAENVVKDTGTDLAEWAYVINPDIEVHDSAKADAPVIGALGQILVRVMPEQPVAGATEQPFVRVITPAGKVGFVRSELIAPLVSNQLCYVKDASGWKIAGYLVFLQPSSRPTAVGDE